MIAAEQEKSFPPTPELYQIGRQSARNGVAWAFVVEQEMKINPKDKILVCRKGLRLLHLCIPRDRALRLASGQAK